MKRAPEPCDAVGSLHDEKSPSVVCTDAVAQCKGQTHSQNGAARSGLVSRETCLHAPQAHCRRVLPRIVPAMWFNGRVLPRTGETAGFGKPLPTTWSEAHAPCVWHLRRANSRETCLFACGRYAHLHGEVRLVSRPIAGLPRGPSFLSVKSSHSATKAPRLHTPSTSALSSH